MGRPLKLTEESLAQIVDMVRGGNNRDVAFRCAGVTPRWGYTWLARGREALAKVEAGEAVPDSEHIFMRLAEGIEKADGQSEARLVLHVNRAAEADWRAAMAMLKAKWPDRYSERRIIEHTSAEGAPPTVVVYLPENSRDD